MNKIVIIDTGVELESSVVKNYRKEVVGIKVERRNDGTFDAISTFMDPLCVNDTVGHGTAVAGIILSHNPNASIFFVKLFEKGELLADEDALV